ncbi:MAG TPA: hypothetical protein VFU02_12485 [Polyangiaceae bacterium]|nr:hypothetical protein [Polyangiaceae bacterium]
MALCAMHLRQEHGKRAFHDRGGIAIGDLVGQQVLKLLEGAPRVRADGHLKPVAPGASGAGSGE